MGDTKTQTIERALADVHSYLMSEGKHRLLVDIDTFREVYRHLYESNLLGDKQVFGILFERTALLWFPSNPNLEFVVQHKAPLSKDDFSFVLTGSLYGSTDGAYSFPQFVVGELRNWRTWVAVLLGAGTALGVFFGAPKSSSGDVISAMIPAVALFVSVFVLFAVSQRTLTERDAVLLKSPVYHRYGQIDKYVAWILAAGLLASLASLVGAAAQEQPLSNYIGSAAFQVGTLAVATFTVTWGVTSLIGFYFERSGVMQHLTAVPALKEVLQTEYKGATDTPGED